MLDNEENEKEDEEMNLSILEESDAKIQLYDKSILTVPKEASFSANLPLSPEPR